ncbi:hypothetical protein O6H91_11G092300 [Diphasiastrum complanatum]|uniref:Uncharacterized protein n=1 Tax=Diphasiastrum complanatum TaxID=34168 RepID=A0ACC2CBW1_DIPCM|nr:hypothetical protein O6H91_11G092300 [Diphasiastrum complanatum]
MAPFIEAVDSQTRSHFIVKSWCHLLRVRWERSRHRTQERAYLMMENLVEEIQTGTTLLAQRLCYVFCVPFPTIAALLKEFAELKVSCGLVREALSLFEELELWDNLIDCYCLLGKKGTATHLIKERLEVQPEDPRLWCSLGDVTLDESCYVRAWEVSNHRFGRAQRSLARATYNRGDYTLSMEQWAAALALNPLHPDGWFALGSAALKAKEYDKALQAFTRSVQLDPDNAESWNNIAAINMHKQKSREAFVAFREALKFKRGSWQMWENFSQVAIDIGNYLQAATAIEKVLDLSRGKHVDLPSLTKLIEELEKRQGFLNQRKIHSSLGTSMNSVSAFSRQKDDGKVNANLPEESVIPTIFEMSASNVEEQNGTGSTDTHAHELNGLDVDHSEEVGLSIDIEGPKEDLIKERELLLDIVGKLLGQVVEHGNADGEVWGLQARWYRIKGDLPMASQALLKQVRALQGSNWQHNLEHFKRFSSAAVHLCEIYLEIFECTGIKQNFSSAQMLLRNTIKQDLWEIWLKQTTFLNGVIEEDIYMSQLEGYELERQRASSMQTSKSSLWA